MIALFLLAAFGRPDAAEELDSAELISMLDHAAIVEEMVRSCDDARPDVALAFVAARQGWWARNARVREALDALKRQIDQPRARRFLDYYHRLQQSLRQEIEDLRRAGHNEYASPCDGVLEDLTHGRLDYRPSGIEGNTG